MNLVKTVLCILTIIHGIENRDYCEADDFEPSCGDKSVVVMTTARYGRMRLGSCVREDLGYVGCKSNVLPHVDWRCSGKPSCKIRIPDGDLDQTRPCPGELKTYLEASYICVQVETPTRPCIDTVGDNGQLASSAPWSINRSFGSGYLVSDGQSSDHAGLVAGCATERSPLRIVVRRGQRLNFTVFDFGYGRFRSVAAGGGPSAPAVVPPLPETAAACDHFLVLAEPEARRRVKICPSGWRMRGGAYVSGNNTVDVYFKRMSIDDHRFLLQFSVVGCPELSTTNHMVLTRFSDGDVELACRLTGQKWRLMCVDNHWHGIVGNCTIPMPLGETEDDIVGQLSHGTAIAVVLCVALLMGILVLVLGAVGLVARRCRRRRPVPSSMNVDMMKSVSGHEYGGVEEPVELHSGPVIDSSDYMSRVLCTGCGRDFDVLRSDKVGYAPVASAHAHGAPEVGTASFADCRSLSVVPLEPESSRRGAGSKLGRQSTSQTIPGRGAGTDCGITCTCHASSSRSDECADSTSFATWTQNKRDKATSSKTCDWWRGVEDTRLT